MKKMSIVWNTRHRCVLRKEPVRVHMLVENKRAPATFDPGGVVQPVRASLFLSICKPFGMNPGNIYDIHRRMEHDRAEHRSEVDDGKFINH